MHEAKKASWITDFIGLGSNLRDRVYSIQKALTLLTASGHFHLENCSLLYETKPVGPPQPDFLNGAAKGTTDLSSEKLLTLLKKLEKELGREERLRWGPRAVDLDILFYGDAVVETPSLTIPHPRLHEREFVLVPLAELEPTFRHPKLRKTALELLEEFYLYADDPASRAVEALEPVTQAAGPNDRLRPDDGGAS